MCPMVFKGSAERHPVARYRRESIKSCASLEVTVDSCCDVWVVGKAPLGECQFDRLGAIGEAWEFQTWCFPIEELVGMPV